jgi:Tfp pilus assembly protein PilF
VIRSVSLEEFVRRLRADTHAEKRFALFLGAGCSVTSGIPSAAGLVRDRWLPRLRDYQAPNRADLEDWASEVISGYDPANPALSYGLSDDRKDYDAAEAVYKRALDADPKNAKNLGNYADFLQNDRTDYDAADAMYKRALDADPKNATNLGNYAHFLQNDRKDYDAAEAMYKRALDADPKNANNLGNYAVFLQNDRKDYDAAEAMYKRALDADPKNANNLGNYAVFLQNDRKDYDAAEAMYKRALEADPKHANSHANRAGMLLANGSPDGLIVLNRALKLLHEVERPRTELECLFYLFANGPLPDRTNALRNARRLLEQGVRSPRWDLSRNVERAFLDGHSEGPWLPKLAAVINGDAHPDLLSDWPAWQSASA